MISQMDDLGGRLYLVDAQDEPIGAIDRHEIPGLEASGRGFTRAVGVFVMNNQGDLWIPRRQLTKKIAPGGLDFSAGEHVGLGETYIAAAIRGLHEELRLEADSDELTEVGIVPPFPGMPYFHRIFLFQAETVPSYDQRDFSGYDWLAPQRLAEMLTDNTPAKEVLLPSVQLILHNLDTTGATA
jgi:8-oxo-dGTP pyrophosphatase MutT (NUDIX family)